MNPSRTSAPRHSIVLLTHLRWISALLVAFGHFRGNLLADYTAGGGPLKTVFYFMAGFGHPAVMVFFVLSGFLVGQKIRGLAAEPSPDLRSYLIDRTARIFVVALPAIAWSLLLLGLVVWLAPHSQAVAGPSWSVTLSKPLEQDLNPLVWLGTAAMLNTIALPTPQIEAPLWSLSCEWTYYMMAIAGVALLKRRWSWTIPYALVLTGLSAWFNPGVLLNGLVWLMGLAASLVSDHSWFRGRITCGLAVAIGAACFALSRSPAFPDLALGLGIAILVAHRAWRTWSFGARFGERIAGFSYTLYVIHFPITAVIAACLTQRFAFGPAGMGAVLGGVALSLAVAFGIAQLTEFRTRQARAWLTRAVDRLSGRPPSDVRRAPRPSP
jgi:peptidoglycan/LPS O-acetylase OafA/YrhL